MKRSPFALRPFSDPTAEIRAFSRAIEGVVDDVCPRARRRTQAAQKSAEATATAFAAFVARIALSRVPPKGGQKLSFREGDYVSSGLSYTALVDIRDALAKRGLIKVGRHFHDRLNPTKSFPTRVAPETSLAELARSCGVTLAMVTEPPAEIVVLKGGPSPMPEDVSASGAVLRRYNEFVRHFELTLPEAAWIDLGERVAKGSATNGKGSKLHRGYSDANIFLVRRFAETYERGGRLYDGFWQNMPKDIRAQLMINGEATVELDFARIHPNILFAKEGLTLDRDPYKVPGYEHLEEAGKLMFNRLLNSKKRVQFGADDRKWFSSLEQFNSFREAMERHLSSIAHSFKNDMGAKLQKEDSQIALDVISECMDRSIPVYPVHDSFIVSHRHADQVEDMMKSFSSRRIGVMVPVKRSSYR